MAAPRRPAILGEIEKGFKLRKTKGVREKRDCTIVLAVSDDIEEVRSCVEDLDSLIQKSTDFVEQGRLKALRKKMSNKLDMLTDMKQKKDFLASVIIRAGHRHDLADTERGKILFRHAVVFSRVVD